MSFSSETKNELARVKDIDVNDKRAELSAIVRMSGTIQFAGLRKINVKITTELNSVARRVFKLLKKEFNIETTISVNKNQMLKRNNSYVLMVKSENGAEKLLKKLGILEDRDGFFPTNCIPKEIFEDDILKKAYLRGAFLGGGSISDPEKNYHMEFVTNNEDYANSLRDLINSFGLNSKIVARKNSFVVYLKESEQISDLLSMIGAYQALLSLQSTKIVKEITEQVMASGFNGVFIIASNPVDLMSYVVSKVSGLPTSKVIGSGTVLDTARLRYLIAEYLDVSSKNVHAYILGEHGDSSFVPWEHCYVGCKKMVDIMEDNNYPMEDLKKIHDGVWKAAYEIIDKKRATYYGIGMALNRLVKAVLNDENAILTVSTYQNGEYEQEGLYIGVPAIINKNGVKEILKLKLSEEDQAKFDHSCDIMKENIKNEIDPMLKQ